MFDKLFHSLRMQDQFDPFTPLLIEHIERIRMLFGKYLITNPYIDQRLRKALSNLSEKNFSRIVCSPYVAELMILLAETDHEPTINAIHAKVLRALVAEVKSIDPTFQHRIHPLWTINGDQILDEEIGKKFPAISTSCGIALNYQSYAHNTDRETIAGYNYKIGLKHKERIETAMEIIRNSSSAAHSLIETYVTIIQFRQNRERSNAVNSSNQRAIGLIYCDNFHKIHNDLPEIVDMLVHESIHQHLHLFEEQVCPFLDLDALPEELISSKQFPSPWSGKKLDISSYSHAVLVWMGLVHFWRQFINRGVWHQELGLKQAEEKLSEALFGFRNSESVLDGLGGEKKYLNKTYVEWVHRTERELHEKKHPVCV